LIKFILFRIILLTKYISRFGIYKGNIFFFKRFIAKNLYCFKISKLNYPLYLRSKSSDFKIFTEIFIDNEYDFKSSEIPEVIIDCGANIGLATVYFKNKYPDVKIFAIEPDINNFELLKKNTEFYDDIVCINAAVWNQNSFIALNVLDLEECAYRSYECTEKDTHLVNSITIENIIDKYNLSKIDILKIDVEGAEKEIFSNNYKKFLDITEMIMIELHDLINPGSSENFFKALKDYKFRLITNKIILGIKLFKD
jgi:FkbM family methyltransferase